LSRGINFVMQSKRIICDNMKGCNQPAVQYVIWIGDNDAYAIAACEFHRSTSKFWKEISEEDYIVAQIILE
jgi:hypothetical protein